MCAIVCMKLILVSCVLELTVRQDLHFFRQYRYYILLFTEICINKPNHKSISHFALSHVLIDSGEK